VIIQSSGGLSEDEIEKMVRDAEANADADSKRRQTIDAKNEIDSLIYSTEKTLADNADKVSDEIKKDVETAIAAAKDVKDSDDLEALKSKTEELNKAAMKVGQAIYGQQQQQEGDAAASDAGDDNKTDEKDSSEEKKDETEDADFKEKKDSSSEEKK